MIIAVVDCIDIVIALTKFPFKGLGLESYKGSSMDLMLYSQTSI